MDEILRGAVVVAARHDSGEFVECETTILDPQCRGGVGIDAALGGASGARGVFQTDYGPRYARVFEPRAGRRSDQFKFGKCFFIYAVLINLKFVELPL